jgi:hypothetical protein
VNVPPTGKTLVAAVPIISRLSLERAWVASAEIVAKSGGKGKLDFFRPGYPLWLAPLSAFDG